MKLMHVVGIVGLTTLTALAFQNCSRVAFSELVLVEASKAPQLPEVAPACRLMTAEAVKPQLLYSWNYQTDIDPTFKQVMASPVVGDLDGDKIPEIGFVSYQDGAYTGKGVLRILNGRTGASKFSIHSPEISPYASTAPLFADIDRDGKAEIFYLHYLGKKVIALNSDGSLRWEQPLDFTGTSLTYLSACMEGFSAADLDGDGQAEIIAGSWIIKENASKIPTIQTRLADVSTSCHGYAANLSADPQAPMRILGRSGVFNLNGQYLFRYEIAGIPASADIRPDIPGIEVVVSGNGYLSIYNGNTGEALAMNKLSEHSELICRLDANGNGVVGGGQATIGDFDGDSTNLEIAVATGKSLTIFNSKGEKIAGSVTQDCSSLSTGLTSFDFNGDGKPEIIYADEQYVRIYEMDGSKNLKVIWQEINPSGTLREYPVVADVTGDGYANLVVVSNNMWVDTNSVYQTADQKDLARNVTGLRVFSPQVAKSWMPTRPVWNQHAYMASNVTDELVATNNTFFNGAASLIFKRNIQKGLFQEVCKP